jgi:hypothetical protein
MDDNEREKQYTPTEEDVFYAYLRDEQEARKGANGDSYMRWFRALIAKEREDAKAEAMERAALIAESDVFWTSTGERMSSDEVAYNVGRREASAAIRAAAGTEQG